jgi:hypothetical protein
VRASLLDLSQKFSTNGHGCRQSVWRPAMIFLPKISALNGLSFSIP